MTTAKISLATARRYASLTKPGVLFGNVITGVAGFLLASTHLRTFNAGLFTATIAGMTLIIASACVLNNVLDRDIDQVMQRTKKRAVANGSLPAGQALTFSVVLGSLGLSLLVLWANWLVVAIGVGGFIVYVWLYGAWSKRHSIHGTLVGSISGAAPILAGYCAVTGQFDAGALLVFLALFFWQFPEFYAIAIYRLEEYKAASIPLMSVVKGVPVTKVQIFVYTLLFGVSVLLLTPLGYTGKVYEAVMLVVVAYWLWLGLPGLRHKSKTADDQWARRMFHYSLNALLIYSFMIAIGPLLP